MKKIYFTAIFLLCLISANTFAQCQVPSLVPYYEGFTTLVANNQVPPCWTVSNNTTCLTNAGNNGSAAFSYSSSSTSYFYSNAILLQTGVTYSISTFYKMSSANSGFTNFSTFLGTTQSAAGLITLASTNNPANTNYQNLGNTFTVATSGIYYVAIGATTNNSGNSSQLLIWDDLSITTPCGAANNTPTLSLSASSTTICSGDQIVVSANGANIYTWNGSPGTNTFTATPLFNTTYQAVGTNTLSNCSSQASITIIVRSKPNILVSVNNPNVCLGSSVTLNANGAANYFWSNGLQGNMIIVSPTITTTYSVTGSSSFSCSSMASLLVNVNPLPVITVSNSSGPVCAGQAASLTATGAITHNWLSDEGDLFSGNLITFIPTALITTFTVSGADANGCLGTTNYTLQAITCTGLPDHTSPERAFIIYPNPGHGEFILESANATFKSVIITDVLGKVVFSTSGASETTQLNIQHLANGIYQVKISSPGTADYLRIVKQ